MTFLISIDVLFLLLYELLSVRNLKTRNVISKIDPNKSYKINADKDKIVALQSDLSMTNSFLDIPAD